MVGGAEKADQDLIPADPPLNRWEGRLAGGIALHRSTGIAGADTTGYLLGMVALGVGSLPFWHVVGRGPWLSSRLAHFGMVVYALLTAGAVAELVTGRGVTVAAAIPGGLFEIIVGIHLLRRGFGTPTGRRSQDSVPGMPSS